ncbi:MAG: NAD(P)H-hydrate dehydratase [Pseudomonadota bacterium]
MAIHHISKESLPLARLAKADGHKFDHGHVLVLTGPAGRTGAARLAARGALRLGAGLVTLGVPPEAKAEVAAHLTAMMLRPVKDAEDLNEILTDNRFSALCLGPALGVEHMHSEIVECALASHRATVLDADALTLLSKSRALMEALHGTCVLTPHAGEFARLFPDLKLVGDVTDAERVCAAAEQAGCVILLKGARTFVATPAGDCGLHTAQGSRAAPWLATAGAGDVLAGFIAGAFARGFAPALAAEISAWLHVECALSFGPGLIAEDLPEQLPLVFRQLF